MARWTSLRATLLHHQHRCRTANQRNTVQLANAKHEVAASFATLYDGHCDKVKRLDLWLHLFINVLSTLLLGASNYCMQCLAAPTREDIDKAHGQNGWMDVGVPSVRNLRRYVNLSRHRFSSKGLGFQVIIPYERTTARHSQ